MTATASVIDRYFEATSTHDAHAIVDLFTPTAIVVDEGKTHRGTAEIREWQDQAASEYEYTTTIVNRVPAGDTACAVTVRLEGNFPGGTADLTFDFLLADGLISGLTIAPLSRRSGSRRLARSGPGAAALTAVALSTITEQGDVRISGAHLIDLSPRPGISDRRLRRRV